MMKGVKSLLFVPAQEKRLYKIGKTDADAYIIDLEDSISAEEKDSALERTVRFLTDHASGGVFVRVNRNRCRKEIERLNAFDVGYMLPKFEAPSDYDEILHLITDRSVIALVETPLGLVNAASIAALPFVTAMALGAEDFTVATGFYNEPEYLAVPKSILSVAAKAYHKKVYDTPCFRINDEDVLKAELEQAVKLGYDGKLAIHPGQTGHINEAFRVLDPEYIEYIIDTYDAGGRAVCEIDGRVYEKMHIDRFRKLLRAGQDQVSAEEGR